MRRRATRERVWDGSRGIFLPATDLPLRLCACCGEPFAYLALRPRAGQCRVCFFGEFVRRACVICDGSWPSLAARGVLRWWQFCVPHREAVREAGESEGLQLSAAALPRFVGAWELRGGASRESRGLSSRESVL